MAETFAQKKVPEAPVEKPPELSARIISRGPVELHSPIDALGNAATHSRIRSEGAAHSVAQADFQMRVLKNVQEYLPEGAAPLSERFGRLLRSV
jgi:hypothetical protein